MATSQTEMAQPCFEAGTCLLHVFVRILCEQTNYGQM